MSTWRHEPRGSGRSGYLSKLMVRFELLAYACDAGNNRLANDFEIFARDRRGRYVDQAAIGEAASLNESKCLAEAMVRHLRSRWPAPVRA